VWVAIGTQNPVYSNGTVNIGELTIAGYARVQYACNSTNFSITSPRTLKNLTEVKFIQASALPDIISQATTDWPPIVSYALYATQTGTDPLYFGSFPQGSNAVIYNQDILRLGINAIVIGE
jgi:hypothetical protein